MPLDPYAISLDNNHDNGYIILHLNNKIKNKIFRQLVCNLNYEKYYRISTIYIILDEKLDIIKESRNESYVPQ